MDNIKSVLNESIDSLSQLYITLGKTQEENKEKINKTQEEINKTQKEIKERIDNALFNLPDHENPQDAATKNYADDIKSILNESIDSLSQLYITLGKTQEENKEKINKTQEEINKRIDKTQKEINERIDNTLFNLPDPENLQNAATKNYVDNIKSILSKSIISLSQLYITLGRTQEENKEKINKTQEEINKTQEDINERIDKTQKEIKKR